MAEKRKAPDSPESARRAKRAAPTIDLTATEIKPSTGGEPPPAQNTSPPPQNAPQAGASEPASEPPAREAMREAPAESERQPTSPPPPPPPQTGGGSWSAPSALAGGLAGGAVVAMVAGLFWAVGTPSAPAPQSADMSGAIAALQKEIDALKNRPTGTLAPAGDLRTIDALGARIARLENTLANLPGIDSGLVERLAAAENAMKSLGVALTALNKHSDDVAANAAQTRAQAEAAEKAVADLRASVQSVEKNASAAVAPAELDTVQRRIAAIEQSLTSAREEVARTAKAEKAVRLVLSASALRSAVASGAPFAAELAQAKALGADDTSLAALSLFASSGVPSDVALAQELRTLLPSLQKASGTEAPQGGFLERLQANAGKLVRVTPVNAPRGDDAVAILARIDVALARADIAAALVDLAKLPETARAPAQAWIARAEARRTVLAAATNIVAAAARALNLPGATR